MHIALQRLEKRGFLESRLQPRADGEKGRPRRHYAVTERGLHRAQDARRCLEGLWKDLAMEAET